MGKSLPLSTEQEFEKLSARFTKAVQVEIKKVRMMHIKKLDEALSGFKSGGKIQRIGKA